MLLKKELRQRRIMMETEKVKKRHYIYLAGNISEDSRTYTWRKDFIKLLDDEPGVVMIDPCENDFDQDMKTARTGT